MAKKKLSKKSAKFLDDLRVYLFSNGKKEEEVQDVVGELESHLVEAEANGKSIEHVIGDNPKVYMEMISREMGGGYRDLVKYAALIIVSVFAFAILSDLAAGNLSYSLLEIIGYVIISLLFITVVFVAFKYLATMKKSSIKQLFILFIVGLLPITLFVLLIYLNKTVTSPMIHFGKTGSLILGAMSLLLLARLSIWAKTWAPLIIVALVALPDYLLNLMALQEETKLILSSLITFGGIALYIIIITKREKATRA